MTGTPEQNARRDIDANLEAAGWLVQSRSELDLPAGRGGFDDPKFSRKVLGLEDEE